MSKEVCERMKWLGTGSFEVNTASESEVYSKSHLQKRRKANLKFICHNSKIMDWRFHAFIFRTRK